ncbi:MAG: putative nucleolin protein nsr1, partial [Streblomastix strix]
SGYQGQNNEASTTLFVGNLSFQATKDTLLQTFADYNPTDARITTDRNTGRPKGFGYIEFSSPDDSKNALDNMNGYELDGRGIRLDYSTPKPQGGGRDSQGGGQRSFGRESGGYNQQRGNGGRQDRQENEPSNTLFIGNLVLEQLQIERVDVQEDLDMQNSQPLKKHRKPNQNQQVRRQSING